MLKTLLLQAAAIVMVAGVAGLAVGVKEALSALAGGLIYFLPNLLFVLRLVNVTAGTGRASALGFLVGEAVKLAGVIALLVLLPHLFDLSWPACIAGLSVMLFVNLFALLLKT